MICDQCGRDHPIDEMELSFRRPDDIVELSQDDRKKMVRESDDLCIIEGKRFFVRAVLPLKVEGRRQEYAIGLWVEVGKSAFERIRELWDESSQDLEPPFDARISNSIPTLPETRGVPVVLHLSGPKTRPKVYLAPGSNPHPLYVEQSEGITLHRVHVYNSLFS